MLRRLLDRFRYRRGNTVTQFDVFHIPGVIYTAKGPDGGHIRLFQEPIGGVMIYSWNTMLGGDRRVRRWYFGPFMTITHLSVKHPENCYGKKPGFAVSLPFVKFQKEYRGFSVRFFSADKGYCA